LSTKLAGLLILGIDKKTIKKLMLHLIKEVILYIIKDKLMKEFKKRNLHIKYKDKIEDWLIYMDQKKFGYQLNKKMLIEVNRFMANKKTVDEILAELFEEPKWVIEIEEGLMEKYPELSIENVLLGYS